MSSDSEIEYGKLIFFRKDDSKGPEFTLLEGETTIGGSLQVDIRLKLKNVYLKDIHCHIEVFPNGKVS